MRGGDDDANEKKKKNGLNIQLSSSATTYSLFEAEQQNSQSGLVLGPTQAAAAAEDAELSLSSSTRAPSRCRPFQMPPRAGVAAAPKSGPVPRPQRLDLR